MFIYSRRVGTPGDKMENQVPEEIKHIRFDKLKKLVESQIEENNQKYIGTIQKVLVEGESKNNKEMLSGRTDSNKVVIFEEAAGVLKYKRRKEEAIRKLDKTNQNLNRVNDIINELNSNIIPLEEASNKAKKYIEYKDRLSNIEVAVIAKEIKDLNFEYQEGKKRIEELENEITKVSTDSSTYDIDILKYKDKLKEVRDNINKSQVLLIDLSKREEKITSDIRLLQERNKYRGEESLTSFNLSLYLSISIS